MANKKRVTNTAPIATASLIGRLYALAPDLQCKDSCGAGETRSYPFMLLDADGRYHQRYP